MRCTFHPDVETSLRCGKCERPICPKCMVQTPVGARCPDCAKLYKLPTFRVDRRTLLVAGGVGLGMALGCGLAWGLIERVTPFFSFSLLLAPAAGYAISEVIMAAVNRKRGRALATVAGAATALCYIIKLWVTGLLYGVPLSGVIPSGVLGLPYQLLALGLGVFIAVTRIR